MLPPDTMTAAPVRSIATNREQGLLGRLVRYARAITYDLARTAASAADLPSAFRMGFDLATFRLLEAVWAPSGKIRRVRIRPDTRLSYRQNKGDIYSIHEIWFEESYRLPVELQPHVLVDIGANIGMTSLWLAKQYRCKRIIAVEPSAGNAAVARENFANNGIAAEVFEAAAGSRDGMAKFYEVSSSTNGRLVFDGDETADRPVGVQKAVPVRIMSMGSILRSLPPETPIDLLKVDIEGGEQDLLTGEVSWLARVKALLIEFHPSLIDYPRLVGIIERSGMRRVHSVITDQHGGNTLELFLREP
jgi:FkbM family methyltransferase